MDAEILGSHDGNTTQMHKNAQQQLIILAISKKCPNNVHNVTPCPSQLTRYGYCNDYGLMSTISHGIWKNLVFANLWCLIEQFMTIFVERPLINDLKTWCMPCIQIQLNKTMRWWQSCFKNSTGCSRKRAMISLLYYRKLTKNKMKNVFAMNSDIPQVLFQTFHTVMSWVGCTLHPVFDMAPFSSYAKLGPSLHLADHSDARVRRDCRDGLCYHSSFALRFSHLIFEIPP